MDSTLIAYSVSFASVLVILYIKMRKQFVDLLNAKQKEIKDVMKTAEYINNVSMTTLYDEAHKNGKIDQDVNQIKTESDQKIMALLNAHKNFQTNLQKQLAKELEEHIQQINGQFTTDMREEICEVIMNRLQKRLTLAKPMHSPAEQFAKRMQEVQCV